VLTNLKASGVALDADIAGTWQRIAWFLAAVFLALGFALLAVRAVPNRATGWHACKLGCEDIVPKRLWSRYRSSRSPHWLKIKNPAVPAVKREAEEDWRR
jgi:hypothetical protein